MRASGTPRLGPLCAGSLPATQAHGTLCKPVPCPSASMCGMGRTSRRVAAVRKLPVLGAALPLQPEANSPWRLCVALGLPALAGAHPEAPLLPVEESAVFFHLTSFHISKTFPRLRISLQCLSTDALCTHQLVALSFLLGPPSKPEPQQQATGSRGTTGHLIA